MNIFVIVMLLFLALTRIFLGTLETGIPPLTNLFPLSAIAFLAPALMKGKYSWAYPLVILFASDIVINLYLGVNAIGSWTFASGFCYLVIALIGSIMQNRHSWTGLLMGSLSGSIIFYLITNTFAFFSNPYYSKNVAGWVQALTIGMPGYPPTVTFFKHSLMGDVCFTLITLLALNWYKKRREGQSLPLWSIKHA